MGTPSPRHPLYGSSPLTRGKLPGGGYPETLVGLIPAHAGKTALAALGIAICGAHPRSRGENKIAGAFFNSEAGSSPLTRGKRTERTDRIFRSGLIPAHAGKTAFTPRAGPSRAAHPRSRGENAALTCRSLATRGSSPLTRGKLHHPNQELYDARLIPAHAGKTSGQTTGTQGRTAHPRSRGENDARVDQTVNDCGSSPLTRGKRAAVLRDRPSLRLIPAHAGKTPGRSHPPRPPGAHPRSRGENHPPSSTRANTPGSSPLTRGKQAAIRPFLAYFRLIPAHAGKTADSRRGDGHCPAHPRSRGEN